jgi:hypothetical protein
VLDEKMKDEVKITVIATGFKETSRSREQANAAATAVLSARAAASATFQVPSVREPETTRPAATAATPAPRINERPHNVPYSPETSDDLELGSEVVRHAEPVEDSRTASASYTREAESTYANVIKGSGAPHEEPEVIDTVSSSVNITYDADDLEVPAFLRKRGEG